MLKNYKKQNAESSDVCCPYADMTSTNVNVIFIILQENDLDEKMMNNTILFIILFFLYTSR